jgi:uracil-DNA glycosylase family 4
LTRVEALKPTEAFNGIMLIGEAPGEQEEKEGIPFVGASGRALDGMLEEVGIRRSACYITNLIKHRPTNNTFSSVPKEDLSKYKAELLEEISIVRPNVIVTLGEHSFNAVTGYKGITSWRGSIIGTTLGKVIPVIHPSAILREWKYRPMSVCDLRRAREHSLFPEVRLQPRNIKINPTYDEVIEFLDSIIRNSKTCSFDIETETDQISCIGFATSETEAICIPFWFGSSGSMFSKGEEILIWLKIKAVLESPCINKIAQNAQYDMTILRDKYNIHVQGLWLDTMIAFHSVYPELPKSLAFLCSLYTDVPYYKYYRTTNNMDAFFRYNATDAVVTYECAMKIYNEMKEFNVVDFYYEHMHSLITPLMDISSIGVRVDTERKKRSIKEMQQRLEEYQVKLESLVGHELNVNSPKQMKGWLYDELKLKPKFKLRKDKGEKTISADEDALEDLYKESGNEALKIVLDIREARKLLSTYLEVKYDREGGLERARTSYLITGTETGRLSSRETVYGTGTNMQNIPKGIVRQIFIPDEGKVFVNADLSQAEARVVAWLAQEDRLIQVFRDGGDIHSRNAAKIFRKAEVDVTASEREIAKRVIHASNYGMGPITFSRQAGVKVVEAKRLLNAYFAEFPRIKLWHMSIDNQLRNTRTLVTPLGRRRTFFNRWDESLKKEAYAYIPQSTVADLLNMGLRRLYARYLGTDVEVLLQIHDAVLLQVPIKKVSEIAQEVKNILTIPLTINHREMVIPVDISTGNTWNDLKKITV